VLAIRLLSYGEGLSMGLKDSLTIMSGESQAKHNASKLGFNIWEKLDMQAVESRVEVTICLKILE
jgi:hypothetical protein